jgi:Na+/glutamate symporter
MLINLILYAIWGCIPEITNNCPDMTNSSSTYFSIVIGAIIGGIVSWWIYNRQKKTTIKQDDAIEKIKELNERHDNMLKAIEQIEKNHQIALEAILKMDKKIEQLMERYGEKV